MWGSTPNSTLVNMGAMTHSYIALPTYLLSDNYRLVEQKLSSTFLVNTGYLCGIKTVEINTTTGHEGCSSILWSRRGEGGSMPNDHTRSQGQAVFFPAGARALPVGNSQTLQEILTKAEYKCLSWRKMIAFK